MIIHKTTKQKLLSESFSLDALKLARAIYYTHINDDKNLYMEIKLSSICNLLKLENSQDSRDYIRKVFTELNEPLSVHDFKFFSKTYQTRFVIFCKYEIHEDLIEIELSEEFLLAESEYMIDKFLTN